MRAWLLVAGEADNKARAAYLTIALLEVLLALGACVGVGLLYRKRALVGWRTGMLYLVANIAVLWSDVYLVGCMVPASVANWMLSPGHLVFAFFCLGAPALFYCCLCIAGVRLPLSTGVDIGASLGTLCLVPAAWYIIVVVTASLALLDDLPFQIGLAFFILSAAVVCFVFLRLLLWLYNVTGGGMLAVVLAGVIFPFAANQTRHCTLRFLYPRGVAATVRIGDNALTLPGGDAVAPILLASFDEKSGIFVPAQRAAQLPAVRRPRCVHFLLDVSRDAVDAIPEYDKRVAAWLRQHPDIEYTAATAVNFASSGFNGTGPYERAEIRDSCGKPGQWHPGARDGIHRR